MSKLIKRYELERKEQWSKWNMQIPDIDFKPEWKVKPLAPFGGALVRFLVKLGDASVSVYLDVNDSLGCVGRAYWEMYPYENDVMRFYIDEVEDLVLFIDKSLAKQLEQEASK